MHNKDKFPYSVYVVAGSQATKKRDNRIYIMNWCNLCKTLHDDDAEKDDSDEEEPVHDAKKDPMLFYESINHLGGINRIRSMHGSNIIACWSEEKEVEIFNIKEVLERVELKAALKSNAIPNKQMEQAKIRGFKHS